MKCLVIKAFGPPADVLAVDERPTPVPGPGQVRIKLLQSPIHNHDLAIIRGVYGVKPALPAIPGTEAVGVIDQLGPETDKLQLGQRVSVGGVTGAWAEYFLAKAASVVPVPAGFSDDVACQLLAMPLSALMLLEDLALPEGAWLIQNAANGAVGRLVDALAQDRGLAVINLVRRQDSLSQLEGEGVKHVLASDDAGWAAKVATITAGAPVVAAIDSVGGKAANDLMNVLGPGGVLMSFGAMSGQALQIDVANIVFKQTIIKGFWGTRRTERTSREDIGRMIGQLIRLAAEGRLPLRVSAKFSLDQGALATTASERPGRVGKVVFRAD
jgi:NADPH2:quinone reductase